MSPADAAPTALGSLTVVGSGIRAGSHLTQEARVRIQHAEVVLYLLAEAGPHGWLQQLNPVARSMGTLYQTGEPHADVYEGLVEAMLEPVRAGRETCVITYGNPAVFDHSSHEAIRRAQEEGYPARMLPAISSLDCLFVDLALDPGEDGLQCYDADRFLTRGTEPDVTVPLVLWQISVVGETVTTSSVNRAGLQRLADRLAELYGAEHEVTIYEATPFPVGRPSIEVCGVAQLPDAAVGGLSTLFVPPRP
ncbi:MAG TPA: SAM-dependent methyltransferase [Actinomycetota bacterium]